MDSKILGMIDKAPILITGCARSGTSMIAKVVNICGAYAGDVLERNLFENTQIQDIVKAYLKEIGADPRGQNPLPNTNDMGFSRSWGQRIQKVIVEQGYHGGQWLIKDTKMCLMWPVWYYAFPNAKWVIVRRRTGDIIQSCLKTGYMTGHTTVEGWLDWVHVHEQRFGEMINEGLNCKIVWPHRMVYGDYAQLFETIDWLGLKWNNKALSTIDPLLWNSRKKEMEV